MPRDGSQGRVRLQASVPTSKRHCVANLRDRSLPPGVATTTAVALNLDDHRANRRLIRQP